MGHCIRELTLDLGNYTAQGTVFKRIAVRGIIRRQDKYLVIHGKYGDCKFPGGGREPGEELADTLIREVREETGCQVIPESIGDYLLVHEKRKGNPEDWLEMDSWYYFCDIEEAAGERNLDEYEKEYEYQVDWLPLAEMIQRNETAQDPERTPWTVREAMVMRELAGMAVNGSMRIRIGDRDDLEILLRYDRHIRPEDLESGLSSGRVMIAEEGGEMIGWLRWNLFWDNTPFMNMLFLLENYRGLGYGKALVSDWEARMRAAGYRLVMTSTLSGETAQHFYRRLHYTDAGALLLPGEPLEILFTKEI